MPVITVSQLNNYMKRYIERNEHLSDLWIKAEISNFKKHYSGHIYMTLKDEASSLRAVMFKAYADKLKFIPDDGSKIIAFGKISVYERDGSYQFYVESIIPDGKGELYAAYEKLKADLDKEGLFDSSLKKPIPAFPKCVGVITSISGAALRDIMNVIKRRYILCNIKIYPVKVQGIGASDSICEALDYFSCDAECEVVILARGGGSIEDLWAFNEEKTARSISACRKPVISGVGHETDFTISDFVSDMRAPTPSAAAELATPSMDELFNRVKSNRNYIHIIEQRILYNCEAVVKMYSPEYLNKIMFSYIDTYTAALENCKFRLFNSFSNLNADVANKLAALSASLNAMSPKSVLGRGYSMVTDMDDKPAILSSININDNLKIIFNDGYVKCNVLEVKNEEQY